MLKLTLKRNVFVKREKHNPSAFFESRMMEEKKGVDEDEERRKRGLEEGRLASF